MPSGLAAPFVPAAMSALGGMAHLGQAAPAGPSPGESSKKIFVGGLSHETSEADFNAYFGMYGQVMDCVIMCDPHTRKPRGFGFVTYDSMAAVDRACASKFHELNGKRVEVKRAIPQDRMAAEDGAGGKPNGEQNPMLAALSAGFFSGLAPNGVVPGMPGVGHPTHAQQAFNVSMPMNVKAEAAELPALEFSSWDEKKTSSSGTRVAAPRGGARAGAGATFQPTRAGAGSGAAAKLGAAASSSLAAFTPTPDNINDLSEEQLATIQRSTLYQLMKDANLSDRQKDDIKKKRRQIKNRISAKGAVVKKKRQAQGLVAANTHLVQTVEQLQKQNMMLVGRNQELESSFKRVAQLAAERDRERRQYEAEIARLSTMLLELQSNNLAPAHLHPNDPGPHDGLADGHG